jgi:biopolymer transport protein ExbD
MAKKKKDRYGQNEEISFQMAPMIDVVFQLLIFFLCVSTFYKSENLEMVLAYAQTAKELKKDNSTLIVNVMRDGEIVSQNKTFLTRAALQTFMQGLVAEVGGPTFKVAIRADRKSHMKEIKDVYRAAARAGLTRISLVTQTRKQGEQGPGAGPPVPGEEKPGGEDLIY